MPGGEPAITGNTSSARLHSRPRTCSKLSSLPHYLLRTATDGPRFLPLRKSPSFDELPRIRQTPLLTKIPTLRATGATADSEMRAQHRAPAKRQFLLRRQAPVPCRPD